MQSYETVIRAAGWTLSALLGAAFLFSAASKLLGARFEVAMFEKWGLIDHLTLIGVAELLSTILFLMPRTAAPGTLLLSAYLGGAIATHMQHRESYLIPSVFLVLLWVAAGLRMPELFQAMLWGRA